MRLIAFTARDFRRFVEPTSVKLYGDLIAFIGPNEAGKSSLLHGLGLLRSDDPFSPSDFHRRSGKLPELSWLLQLDDDDRTALAEVTEVHSVQRVTVTKRGDGSRDWTFFPARPRRDCSSRPLLMAMIQQFLTARGIAGVPRDPENDFARNLENAISVLEGDAEDLSASAIQSLALLSAQIETLDLGSAAGADDEDSGEIADLRELVERRDDLARRLNAQALSETEINPALRAERILAERLPSMVSYKQEDRELLGSYDLEQVADNPPPALNHLRVLAGLNLIDLRQEIRENRRADVSTRRDAANRALQAAFDKSWNQQKVALQIDVDGSAMFIHAISLDAVEAGLSELSERSDGMRWFASLLAFVHGWSGRPVLLVDEIETHLHYDAQADLVNVLAGQEFTSKVIYTTHSLGCLPPDIGNGVRLVEPIDQTKSRLVNGFWRKGAGFSPLLTSMGAAAVSFTPSRRAVVAEGPSDAILLPTLLRQARGTEQALGFQIVPGVAEVAVAKAQGLTTEAGRVAFLVDGDEGGLENRKKLISGKVDQSLIVVLAAADGEALEVEDLVDETTYLDSINAELALWNDAPPKVRAADLGATLRTKALEAWCLANKLSCPDKIAVAERVIDAATQLDESTDKQRTIYDVNRTIVLNELLEAFESRLFD